MRNDISFSNFVVLDSLEYGISGYYIRYMFGWICGCNAGKQVGAHYCAFFLVLVYLDHFRYIFSIFLPSICWLNLSYHRVFNFFLNLAGCAAGLGLDLVLDGWIRSLQFFQCLCLCAPSCLLFVSLFVR